VQAITGRFRDPNRVNLRKATRAAIVVPAVFVLLVVTGNESSALFGAFGSFAALVFADFGGPIPRRFRAFLFLAVLGAALVALGTACADTIWPAVVVTLVVTFGISLSGALGGYFAAGGISATLAFVLAVMSPGVEADLGSRELGWVGGVVIAGLGAVALWPVRQRDRVRAAAVRVLREAATALATSVADRDLDALRTADAALTDRAGVVYRPAGSITSERALVALVIAARRLLPLLEAVTEAESSPVADATPEYVDLAAQVSAVLAASAQVVAREAVGAPDVDGLARARERHSAALEQWARSVLATGGADRVVDGFTATFALRRLSLAAVQLAEDADEAAHDTVRSRADGEATVAKGWAMVRAHCNVRSVRFRNATRAGLGLALAVLVAKTTSVEHAFWVVLGALSVLRSNALGTGATALQALGGALVGFGIASLLMTTVGGDDTWLWIALPIVVFLAAYTPGAVNFVVGQAGFTVFVVVLFNVLVPDGWRTGLVRVQDVAIGAGISVAVGALLWPRGARGVARRSFAELLRAGGSYLLLALDVSLRGMTEEVDAAAERVSDARARAVAALEDLALEHGGGQVDHQAWGALLVEALVLELAAAGIMRARRRDGGTPVGCTDARDSLVVEGHEVVTSVDREADHLVAAGVRSLDARASSVSAVPPSLGRCLTRGGADGELAGPIALVWVHEWLSLVHDHPR
jgi:uncharacterized membrane protein YccC